MKVNYLKIAIFLVLLYLPAAYSLAQNFCVDCEECKEEVSTGEEIEEDADFVADIGEEGGDMAITETDMLGTEAADIAVEEIAEGATETIEIGSEALVEVGVGVAFDAIPVIGELAMGTMLIVAWVESLIKHYYEPIRHEHEEAHIISGGRYNLPLFPSFTTYANDLNGAKDKVSYLVYLSKRFDTGMVRSYLEEHHLTEHIGKSYDVADLKGGMSYLFSNFQGNLHKNDPSGNPIGVNYTWNVPEINLVKENDSKWYYEYTAHWRHRQNHYRIEHGVRRVERASYIIKDPYVKKWWYDLDTHFERHVKEPVSFWLAKMNDDKTGFSYVLLVPEANFHMEDLGDKVALRIKDLSIPDHGGPYFLTMRMSYFESTINTTLNGKSVKAFPENWNPSSDNKYYKYRYKEVLSSDVRADETVYRFSKDGMYPNTYDLEPNARQGNLFHFQIHDYQPKDTESSFAAKGKDAFQAIRDTPLSPAAMRSIYSLHNPISLESETNLDASVSAAMSAARVNYSLNSAISLQSEANLFPKIYSSAITHYANKTIDAPEMGKTHIRMDIPGRGKKIEYIQLEVLNKPLMLNVHLKDDNTLEAKYSDNKHRDSAISVGIITDTDKATSTFNDTNVFTRNSLGNAITILLKNVPIVSGDIVDIKTYYIDGSLSRDVHAFSYAGEVPRAFYSIKMSENGQYLSESSGNLSFGGSSSGENQHWLIENVGPNMFLIMNKVSFKVFGLVDGEAGMYEWKEGDESLLWSVEYVDSHQIKLINVGQEAYLKERSFSYKDGTTFTIEQVAEAPNLDKKNFLLLNIGQRKLLSISNTDKAVLGDVKPTMTSVSISLEYYSALQYAFYDQTIKKYLHEESGKLKWDSTNKSYFRLKVVDEEDNSEKSEEFYEISNIAEDPANRMVLGFDANTGNLKMKDASDAMNERAYNNNLFKFTTRDLLNNKELDLLAYYTFDGDVKDRSLYRNHGTIYGGVSFVEDSERGLVAKFDASGSSGYVDSNHVFNLLDYSGMSVSTWIKTDTWGGNRAIVIDGGNFEQRRIYYDGQNSIGSSILQSPSMVAGTAVSDKNLKDGKWHHIVSVFSTVGNNEISMKNYVDGSWTGGIRSSYADVMRDISNLIIGGKSPLFERQYAYQGFIDDVKIWGKALTDEEVSDEYRDRWNLPIAHYAFEGNLLDSTPGKHHAIGGGRFSFLTDSQKGNIIKFDGQSSFAKVNFDFNPEDFNGHMSISFWMKNDPEDTRQTRIISGGSYIIAKEGFAKRIKFNTTYACGLGVIYSLMSPEGSLSEARWYHVAITMGKEENGSQITKLYLDGQLSGTSRYNCDCGPLSRSDFTVIGDEFKQGDYSGHSLDDVKIWSATLSDEEVLHDYQAGNLLAVAPIQTLTYQVRPNTAPDPNLTTSCIFYPNPVGVDRMGIFHIKVKKNQTSLLRVLTYGGDFVSMTPHYLIQGLNKIEIVFPPNTGSIRSSYYIYKIQLDNIRYSGRVEVR